MKKKHCSVILLLLSVLLLAELTGCGNKAESTNSASVPSYSSGDTASLPEKEVEEKNEMAEEPESNDTSLEKEPASQEKENATSLWNEFLTSGNYSSYIGDQSTASLEYVITDLNADGVPELLIQSTTDAPFMTTWTFVLNNADTVLANEMYGYGSFRYSPSQNAVIGSPECRPFQGTGWSPFYQLEGTELKYKFQVGEDEGQSYYSDDSGYKNISDDERASYYADAVDFDWIKLSSSDQTDSNNTADTDTRLELSDYLDDFNTFRTKFGGTASDETGDHENWILLDGMQYGNYFDSNSVDSITIIGSEYSIFGIFVDQSLNEADALLSESGWVADDNASGTVNYVKSGMNLTLHYNNSLVTDLSFWRNM